MRISASPAALAAAVLASVLCLGATPALAAQVKQVRVGDHPDFTRIVIELDAPASYSFTQRKVGGVAELIVELEASSGSRVVTSGSRLVEAIGLRPAGAGAVARVSLRSGPVNVKEMLLKSPSRIVLDLSQAPERVAAAPVAPAPKPAPKAAPEPAPAPIAKPAPKAAPTPTATAKPAPAPAPEAAPAPERRQAARTAQPAPLPEREAAESGTPKPAAKPAPGPSPTRPAVKKPPPIRTAEPEVGLAERLGSGDPMIGLAIAGGGVLFLLLAFLALRRRSRRIAEDAASAPWPPPGAVEQPEAAAIDEAEAEGPLFGETEVVEDEGEAPPVVLPHAAVDAEPEVVGKDEGSPQAEELERRIGRLEARLADSLDAKERLERQLAAHTEELRVQRAAIARTQRAVRAAVRGPEAEAAPAQPAGAPAQPEPGQGEG